MSVVGVTNVVVRRNPAALTEPFELEVSFECLEELQEDLEWRLVYVGDAEDKSKDQELDCIALGPVQRGTLRFVFVADAPDFSLINKEDINGITVVLLTGSYRNQEFVRVGWYVHNVFSDPHDVETPPDIDDLSLDDMLLKMKRIILADAPRVTRFHIEWDHPNPEFPTFSSFNPMAPINGVQPPQESNVLSGNAAQPLSDRVPEAQYTDQCGFDNGVTGTPFASFSSQFPTSSLAGPAEHCTASTRCAVDGFNPAHNVPRIATPDFQEDTEMATV